MTRLTELERRIRELEIERESRRPQEPFYFKQFPLRADSPLARVFNVSLRLEGGVVVYYAGDDPQCKGSYAEFRRVIDGWPH